MPSRRHTRWLMVGGAAMATITMITACNPLPGDSVDPVYLRYRGAGATPSEAPKDAGSTRADSAASSTARQPASVRPAVADGIWVGPYRDSRGTGELTLSVVQHASSIAGVWSIRTGGGGPVTGSVELGSGRLQIRMQNTAPGCPGTFEGWAEVRGSALIGAYHGTDCEGAVSDGWLELKAK